MKTTLQKLLSLICAVALLMSYAVAAYAEDEYDTPPDLVSTYVVISTPAPYVEQPPPQQPDPTPAPTPVPTEVPPPDPTQAPPPPPAEDIPEMPTEVPYVDPTEPPSWDWGPTPEPVINGEVRIVIHNGTPGSFQYDEMVILEAIVTGYDNVYYTLTWEYSEADWDGYYRDWYPAPDVNNAKYYQFYLTERNAFFGWRCVVTVVDY